MVGQGVGDAFVAGGVVGPAALFGIGFEGVDVGELVGEGVAEFGCGDVVVAGFADVGVGARRSGWSSAV